MRKILILVFLTLMFTMTTVYPNINLISAESAEKTTTNYINIDYNQKNQINYNSYNSESWIETYKLSASDKKQNDRFGNVVAIDGDRAIVGAYYKSGWKGAAYIYKKINDNWVEEQKLEASDGEAGNNFWDWFGNSVDIDGDYAFVGAEYDNNENTPEPTPTNKAAGAVYVFKHTNNGWFEHQKLIASDGDYWARFGGSIAIDGDTALIGAYGDKGGCEENSSWVRAPGAVYVFKLIDGMWVEQQKLIPSDAGCNYYFGSDVALNGNYAIIGAFNAGTDDSPSIGAAYIFKYDGNSWSQQKKLTASDPQQWGSFGRAVSIYGSYAIVGADTSDDYEGAAYIYKRADSNWIEKQKIKASDANASGGGRVWGRFGCSVSMDGNYAIVGARYHDNWKGSAYLFKLEDDIWVEKQKLTASDAKLDDYFGCSVDISGQRVIIGADHVDIGLLGEDAGSAYIFEKQGVAPEVPTIQGPSKAEINTNVEYTFSSINPTGDDVYLFVDWSDKSDTGWIGPYRSNEKVILTHSWSKEGAYIIRAKAKNVYGAESDWATLPVTMPKSRAFNPVFDNVLGKILDKHPCMFPILRTLFKL